MEDRLQRLSCEKKGAKHKRCNSVWNCSSKTGARRHNGKKTILQHFLTELWKGKGLAPKLRKSADKSLSQPWWSHSNTIYEIQLQKTIVLRMQPRPSNLDPATTMRSAEAELQNTIELRATMSEIAAPKPDGSRRQSRKKTILKHFLTELLQGKLLAPKLRKSADKSLSQPGCSHSNTIYDLQLQKTIVLRMQPRHQATLTQPFQCNLQPQLQETHRTTHTGTTTRCKTHRRNQTTPAAPAAHTRYLSSPPAASLHWKTQGFVLRLPPHNTEHATFMQPFQCDLQPQLQETQRIPHAGTTTRCKTHRRNQTTPAAPAAHTRYLSSPPAASLHGKTQGFVLRLPPHNTEHATFMQPFQCDLQAQIQETQRTTQTGTTTRCKTHRRNQTTPAAPAAHTRYLSSPPAATLHGKTQGFVLRLPPHNAEHATFMQPFQNE